MSLHYSTGQVATLWHSRFLMLEPDSHWVEQAPTNLVSQAWRLVLYSASRHSPSAIAIGEGGVSRERGTVIERSPWPLRHVYETSKVSQTLNQKSTAGV